MADRSAIEWTDATWNPVRGCSRVSTGCERCYAEGQAARFAGPGRPFEGLAEFTPRGPRWTGKIRLVEDALELPLHWRKPRRVFVNSMSDLFHEDVPDVFLLQVFNVMREAHARGHTFQVLTKRAARMADFCRRLRFDAGSLADRRAGGMYLVDGPEIGEVERSSDRMIPGYGFSMVMRNLWLGVSVEDQRAADERIPELLDTPAAVRFLSCEPLLGKVSLFAFLKGKLRDESLAALWSPPMPGLDWVIVGGESGHRARPLEVAWIRSIVKQCRGTNTRCFVKQLGRVIVDRNDAGWDGCEPTDWPEHLVGEDRVEHDESDTGYQGAPVRVRTRHKKGADPTEWPADLRVRQYPEVTR